MIGRRVGQYLITAAIGEGGVGEVYVAEHDVIGRKAAIKFLRKEVSEEERIISRFIEEARAVNGIKHPNIIDITDFGTLDGRHYLVMEHLEGETVAERLERIGPLKEIEAAAIAHQVSSALAAAHEAGFIHRDIKPENLFLANHPEKKFFIKVLDFGITKLVSETGLKGHHTDTGMLVGTPTYMSPEQCLGQQDIDGRSDIYSLGVVLYEMIVGRPPFEEKTLGQMIVAHCYDEPTPPKELIPDTSLLMNRTILQALAKKPADRFVDIFELRKLLRTLSLRSELVFSSDEDDKAPAREPAKKRQGDVEKIEAKRPHETAPARQPKPHISLVGRTGGQSMRGALGRVGQASETDEIKSERVSSKLNSIVRDRITSRRFVLPAMSQVVVSSLKKLEDPNHNFDDLAAIISKDPLIVAQILKIANSVAYTTVQKPVSLSNAVSRLGDRYLKSILLELSARKMFSSRNPKIREALRGIWEHSRATALVAKDLSDFVDSTFEPEIASLAGLLHDAGKPMTAGLLLEAERYLAEQEREFMSHEIWMHVVNQSHRQVALGVARAWKLPVEVSQIIAECGSYNEVDRACLVNCVTLANAIAKRDAPYPDPVDVEDNMAQIFTGCSLLEIEVDQLDELVGDLRDRLAEDER